MRKRQQQQQQRPPPPQFSVPRQPQQQQQQQQQQRQQQQPQISGGSDNGAIRKLIDEATGEPIELYTGELITADNNPGGEEEMVFLSFSKPGQTGVNLASPTRRQNPQGLPSPHSPPPSLPPLKALEPSKDEIYYQAGYQQIEVPEYDPGQLHEDRPQLAQQLTTTNQRKRDPLYPLGRPSPAAAGDRPLRPPRPPRPPRRRQRVRPNRRKEEEEEEKEISGFLDFLIPSFMKSKRKRPRPPPPPPPPPSRTRPKPPPPPPQTPHGHHHSPVVQPPPGSNRRELLPVPPPPDELLSLFPPPHELGGALNPILLRMPDGFSTAQQGFPPLPPPFLNNNNQQHQQQQQQARINARRGEEFRAEEEEEEEVGDVMDAEASDISVTVGTKIKAVKTDNIGGGVNKVSQILPVETRNQVPFVGGQLKPRDYYNYQTTFSQEEEGEEVSSAAVPSQMVSLPKQIYLYRAKLKKDKDFHENLTKSHVYHFREKEGETEEEEEDEYFDGRESYYHPSHRAPSVSYLQDSNPFDFRMPAAASAASAAASVVEDALPVSTLPPPPPLLDEFAPAARPVENPGPKISKPDFDLVYRPLPTAAAAATAAMAATPKATTRRTTSTTTMKTTTTTTESPATSAAAAAAGDDDGDSIAEHISSLLREYLTTPRSEGDAVPNIYMDPEGNSVVVEYLSPEGKTQPSAAVADNEDQVVAESTHLGNVGLMVRKDGNDDGEVDADDDGEEEDETYADEGGDDEADDFVPSTPDRYYVSSLEDIVGTQQDDQQQQQQQQVHLPPELENLVLPKLESDFLKELVENNNLILPQYGKDYQVGHSLFL